MPMHRGVKWAQGLGSCKLFAVAGIPSLNEFWPKKKKKPRVAQIGLGHVCDFRFPSLQLHSYGGH